MSSAVERRQEAVDAIHAEVFADRIARRGQSRTNGAQHYPLSLDDSKIIELASNAKNADHFLSLFRDGDVSRYGGDDSAADLALASMLAFWTGGNAAQIGRIFSQSALAQRSKWGRPDYRERTIATALERTTEFYQPHPNWASPRTPNMDNNNRNTSSGGSGVSPDTWIDPVEDAAFYGPVGEFALAVEPFYEGEPVALLIQSLVVIGNLAGRNIYATVGASKHHANLFIVLVGPTAEAAKGSGWDWVAGAYENVDLFLSDRVHGGLSSGEGLIHCVRDAKSEPRERGKGDARHTEEVEVDPGVDDKRVIIYESEFSAALRVAARPDNIVTEILRRSFNGARILETLIKNNPERATDAHISVVGHITPRELLELLTETALANGFANHFGLFLVRGTKEIAIPDVTDERLQRELAAFAEKARAADAFAQKSCEIRFDADATEVWKSVYSELHKPGPDNLLGSLLARARVHVLRFSMCYAILDCSVLIEAKHLNAALALWRYASRSAAYLFGDKSGNSDADKIIEALKLAPQGLNRTGISKVFANNLSKARIDNALLTLKKQGKAYCNTNMAPSNGRPPEVWFAGSPNR